MTNRWNNGIRQIGEWFAGLHFIPLFLCFFFLLLLVNAAYLFSPPHWDEIIGLHNQALFLQKHSFSFPALWGPGQHSFEGSNVYPYGILPVFYAVLYSFFSPEWVHFCGHLLNIACIAGAGSLLFRLLRLHSLSCGTAFLWILAAFAEPLVAGQTAALGLECPLIFCIMLIVFLVFRNHFSAAVFVLFAAGLVKSSAVIPGIALILFLIMRLILCRDEWKRLLPPLIGAILCTVLIFLMLQHHVPVTPAGLHVADETARDGQGNLIVFLLRKWYFHYELYFPVLFSVILLGCGLFAIRVFGQDKKEKDLYPYQLFLLLVVLGNVLAYLIARTALPRYMATASFPAILFLATGWKRRSWLLALVILFSGLIAPAFYKKLPFGIRRSGEYLERSREYLTEIRANRDLCKVLEEWRDAPIVAPWPIVQMLTMPEMGYVKKPFPHVYSGRVPFYAPVKKLDRPYSEMPENTVYVYHENDFENTGMSNPSLLPDRNSVCLYRDNTLGGLLIVYRRAH